MSRSRTNLRRDRDRRARLLAAARSERRRLWLKRLGIAAFAVSAVAGTTLALATMKGTRPESTYTDPHGDPASCYGLKATDRKFFCIAFPDKRVHGRSVVRVETVTP